MADEARRPTLHVTNWSRRDLHGPGRAFTIAPRPSASERGSGHVQLLSVATPHELRLMAAVEARAEATGDLDPTDEVVRNLRRALEARWGALRQRGALRPGELSAPTHDPSVSTPLRDGDTLCCSCPVWRAQHSLCLRQWLAPVLVAAGWRVIRDGKEVDG